MILLPTRYLLIKADEPSVHSSHDFLLKYFLVTVVPVICNRAPPFTSGCINCEAR